MKDAKTLPLRDAMQLDSVRDVLGWGWPRFDSWLRPQRVSQLPEVGTDLVEKCLVICCTEWEETCLQLCHVESGGLRAKWTGCLPVSC